MKAIRTAVTVVGIGAAILSGVGALGVGIGIAAGTLTAVSTIAGVASTLLTMTAKKPTAGASGSVTEYKLDPNGGIPYVMGRTFYAGTGVKRETWGKDNQYQGFTTVYSYGPVRSFQAFLIDRTTPISFAGDAAVGDLNGFMWLKAQLGAQPSAYLPSPVSGYPGWDGSDRLSGLAASHWVLKFDTKGKKFTGGVPSPGMIVEGVFVYDPRLDSTFPGGNGPCRAHDESTYVYSERPALHGLTYALGRYQNGKRRMGMGFKPQQIDVAAFAQAANVEDANDWRIGGLIYSTDPKWNRLKQIGQAGGWEPVQTGGKLTLIQSAPRVSIATIDQTQMVGTGTVVGTQTRRTRINGMVPRFPSEAHGWQIVPAKVVRVAEYSALDGGDRTEEHDLEFVPYLKQATELTAYEIVNRREIGPIELNLRIRWVGLEPGDCVTLNIPELNLNGQKAIVLTRTLNADGKSVQLSFRSETDAKHPYALGVPGAVPPVPSLTAPDSSLVPAPISGAWTLEAVQLEQGVSGGFPVLRFRGVTDNPNAEAVIFDYRESGSVEWLGASIHSPFATTVDIATLKPGGIYEGGVRYVVRGVAGERRILGPVSVGPLNTAPVNWDNVLDPNGTKPDDNATVGAPPGTPVGDRTVDTLLAEVDRTLADIDALNKRLENGGDLKQYSDAAVAAAELSKAARDAAQTAQALAEAKALESANSATSASGFATTASGSAETASQKATEAGSSASTAAAQARIAETEAGKASVSRSEAATSESNAKGSATAAAASQEVAAAVGGAVGMTPNGRMDKGAALWTTTALTYGNWYRGPGFRAPGVAGTIASEVFHRVDTNRNYRLTIGLTIHGDAQQVYAGLHCFDINKNHLGNVYIEPSFLPFPRVPGGTVNDFSGEYTGVIDGTYFHGHNFIRGTVFVRPMALLNYADPAPVPSSTADISALYLEDITEEVASRGYASASSSSASTAGAKATEAGNSAAAALVSKQQAEAANGTAQTAATNAQSYAAAADGSRATAESASSLSASYRDQAAGSAGAAAGSAGQAASSASAASGSSVVASDNAAAAKRYADTAASVSLDITNLEAKVSTSETAIATLEGYAAARFKVEASAGNGRAQLSVYADSNGGGGVDIVGDLSVRGDVIVDGTVYTRKIQAGSIVDTSSFSAGDRIVYANTALIETPWVFLGAEGYSRAIALLSMIQEPQSSDAGATVRVYIDYGQGYVLQRTYNQGVRASGGGSNAYYRMPVTIPLPIIATGQVRIYVEAESFNLGGGFATSIIRNIQIDILRGAR